MHIIGQKVHSIKKNDLQNANHNVYTVADMIIKQHISKCKLYFICLFFINFNCFIENKLSFGTALALSITSSTTLVGEYTKKNILYNQR